AGRPVITARSSAGLNLDYPSNDVTIPAGETLSYSQTRTFPVKGTYRYSIVTNHSGSWSDNLPAKSSNSITSSGTLTVLSPVNITYFSLSSSIPTSTTKSLNATLTIKNTGETPVNV